MPYLMHVDSPIFPLLTAVTQGVIVSHPHQANNACCQQGRI
jgi:hypothetical protein